MSADNSTDSDILYCAYHPDIETSLRCNYCEKPICAKCAILTPTGYRCKECVRNQQKTFDTAKWIDYPIVVLTVTLFSFLGSLLTSVLGFLTFFLAPVVGIFIAEITRRLTQRRRSRLLFQLAAGAAFVGCLPGLGRALLPFFSNSFPLGLLWPLIWQVVYTSLVTSTVYYRLRGIQI